MFIRSERLFLRPGWPEDWAEIRDRIADEGIVRNQARAPWPYMAPAAQDFADFARPPRHPHFVITLPGADGSRLIGSVGLAPADCGDGDSRFERGATAELGYWITRDHLNRGYATEAARAVLSLARTLGYRRIVAARFADNPASGAVLRKLGFAGTGRIALRATPGRAAPAVAEHLVLDLAAGACDGPMAVARCAA